MKDWMTLLESVRAFWRPTVPAPPRRTDRVAVAVERPPARVPPEYLSLYTYLEHRYATSVVLTFDQMETLLGFQLPLPARTEPGWWGGAAARTDRHADAWMGAGRTATPNLPARTVTFERVS
jgi:hypothetical protein